MLRKKKSTPKTSPLGGVIKTLEKQAVSPAGLSMLTTMAPRLLPIVMPILLGAGGFMGIIPGCKNTAPSGPLPEIRQTIRPGVKPTDVAAAPSSAPGPIAQNPDPTKKPPYQLTAGQKPPAAPVPAGGGAEVVFMFWNMENFFDDRDDHRTGAADKEYDPWFAKNPQILQLKLQKLTEAILSINNGRGPEILAMAEVESVRAAQLLQFALNSKLDPSLQYQNLVMKEMSVGRHIAPAVLTRLPVNTSRTKVLGSRQRILEVHVMNGDKELIVVASHWTSRLQDGSDQRMRYAETIYGAINAIYHANPKADVILCGDFNDNPTDPSVIQGLHATANPSEALASTSDLRLFNLFGTWTPNAGSLYYQGHWNQFDQILVSPGMLDNYGWTCDAQSVRVMNNLTKPNDKNHAPWRFGGEKDTGPRGYSDHFPVSVRLIARP